MQHMQWHWNTGNLCEVLHEQQIFQLNIEASSKHRIQGSFEQIEHPGEVAILAWKENEKNDMLRLKLRQQNINKTNQNATSVSQLRTRKGRKVSCNIMKLAPLQGWLKSPISLGFRTSGCSTLPENDLLNKHIMGEENEIYHQYESEIYSFPIMRIESMIKLTPCMPVSSLAHFCMRIWTCHLALLWNFKLIFISNFNLLNTSCTSVSGRNRNISSWQLPCFALICCAVPTYKNVDQTVPAEVRLC